MQILHKPSETLRDAVVELVETEDWELIYQSDEFKFDWTKERKRTVYKIRRKGDDVIHGLISVEDISKESRIHLHLIENSQSNKGGNKIYDYVAGCLMAFICQMAFEKGYEGFVSLKPKSEIINLYKAKYRFQQMGQHLFVEKEYSLFLMKKYL